MLSGNGVLDEEVGNKAGVGQHSLGDGGGVVLLKPVLHGGPLIGVPIRCYHRLYHHSLQTLITV